MVPWGKSFHALAVSFQISFIMFKKTLKDYFSIQMLLLIVRLLCYLMCMLTKQCVLQSKCATFSKTLKVSLLITLYIAHIKDTYIFDLSQVIPFCDYLCNNPIVIMSVLSSVQQKRFKETSNLKRHPLIQLHPTLQCSMLYKTGYKKCFLFSISIWKERIGPVLVFQDKSLMDLLQI